MHAAPPPTPLLHPRSVFMESGGSARAVITAALLLVLISFSVVSSLRSPLSPRGTSGPGTTGPIVCKCGNDLRRQDLHHPTLTASPRLCWRSSAPLTAITGQTGWTALVLLGEGRMFVQTPQVKFLVELVWIQSEGSL